MRSNRLSYRPVDLDQRTWPGCVVRRGVPGPRRCPLVPGRTGPLSVALGEGDLEAADQVGAHVVDERRDGAQGGHQHDVDGPDDRGAAEDDARGDDLTAAVAPGGTAELAEQVV